MKPGARLASAVDILDQIVNRHRPAAQALSDWGKSNRFAGSGDRAAIGNLVYDALRRRLSLAAQMDDDRPRALIVAAAPRAFAMAPDDVGDLADGSRYCLSPLTDDERANLARPVPSDAPANVRGDYPEWLDASMSRTFASEAAAEGAALSTRAPVDLRVNALKAERSQVLKALTKSGAHEGPHTPYCVRIDPPRGPGRTPNVEAEAAHGRGWFEVQDAG
ncbi:MAG: MFS transporter, partial [Hyphomicrobiaceae bacterium]